MEFAGPGGSRVIGGQSENMATQAFSHVPLYARGPPPQNSLYSEKWRQNPHPALPPAPMQPLNVHVVHIPQSNAHPYQMVPQSGFPQHHIPPPHFQHNNFQNNHFVVHQSQHQQVPFHHHQSQPTHSTVHQSQHQQVPFHHHQSQPTHSQPHSNYPTHYYQMHNPAVHHPQQMPPPPPPHSAYHPYQVVLRPPFASNPPSLSTQSPPTFSGAVLQNPPQPRYNSPMVVNVPHQHSRLQSAVLPPIENSPPLHQGQSPHQGYQAHTVTDQQVHGWTQVADDRRGSSWGSEGDNGPKEGSMHGSGDLGSGLGLATELAPVRATGATGALDGRTQPEEVEGLGNMTGYAFGYQDGQSVFSQQLGERKLPDRLVDNQRDLVPITGPVSIPGARTPPAINSPGASAESPALTLLPEPLETTGPPHTPKASTPNTTFGTSELSTESRTSNSHSQLQVLPPFPKDQSTHHLVPTAAVSYDSEDSDEEIDIVGVDPEPAQTSVSVSVCVINLPAIRPVFETVLASGTPLRRPGATSSIPSRASRNSSTRSPIIPLAPLRPRFVLPTTPPVEEETLDEGYFVRKEEVLDEGWVVRPRLLRYASLRDRHRAKRIRSDESTEDPELVRRKAELTALLAGTVALEEQELEHGWPLRSVVLDRGYTLAEERKRRIAREAREAREAKEARSSATALRPKNAYHLAHPAKRRRQSMMESEVEVFGQDSDPEDTSGGRRYRGGRPTKGAIADPPSSPERGRTPSHRSPSPPPMPPLEPEPRPFPAPVVASRRYCGHLRRVFDGATTVQFDENGVVCAPAWAVWDLAGSGLKCMRNLLSPPRCETLLREIESVRPKGTVTSWRGLGSGGHSIKFIWCTGDQIAKFGSKYRFERHKPLPTSAHAEDLERVHASFGPDYSGDVIALQPNFQHADFPLHIDQPQLEGFGNKIVTLGVKGDGWIVVVRKDGKRSYRFKVGEGDAWAMVGRARTEWSHGVICEKYDESDDPDDITSITHTRVSLNIRVE
ncbi:hypothetical protein M427DRAFT_51715 [Gonapodya prolifera JEL478]|uniref:Alpha-ketoglutarate-dependent dioxygenase AlkB-like domain-containing protein n=1 Tax=Gonapodya prolifera (strain JEL478) TaxID=1344416 RepID=A0A139AVL1_GONPJ|nr:hypothetical protein M427DRAFT_51715 [Gonapodya prolifera JEL478]|eukprot:KXS20739.1 hypothetical protein M427DRAFT_51715 [Gonapodya prolifera JEL478]